MSAIADKLTNSKLIFKNINLNLIILGITIVIGILTTPRIIKGIGVDQWGLLTIIWAVIGYSSIFDMGLGRALTQVVATKLGSGKEDEVPGVVWTSVMVVSVLGLFGALVIYFLSPLIAEHINIAPQFHFERLQSIRYLAFSLPFLIFVFSLKGVLEAYQKFTYTNLLRIPIIIFNYLLPLVLLNFGVTRLSVFVGVLVIGRVLTCGGYFWAVSKTVKNLFHDIRFHKEHFDSLLRYGSWLTVTNAINPLMTYLDRFVIAGILSAGIVGYYSTPYDIISKMTIVTASIMSVIFPALAVEFSKGVSSRARQLYQKSLGGLFALLIVPVIIGVVFAHPLLSLWISPIFADHSAFLAQLIFFDFLMQSLNVVPYSVVQAVGRSDITGKISLIELPVYILVLNFTINHFGIIGAPIAAMVRVSLDSVLMHFFALKLIKQKEESVIAAQASGEAIPA